MPVTNFKTALDASENKSEHFKKQLLPPLGAVGQVLMKSSPGDFDVNWTSLTLYHINGAGDAAGKNVGTGPNDVAAANDSRLSDQREWIAETVTQQEAEQGTATIRRAWTAERIFQAIAAWWAGVNIAISKISGLQDALDQAGEADILTHDSSDSLTITSTHSNKYIRVNRTNNVTVTVPTHTTYPANHGTTLTFIQIGNGVVKLNGASGVTLNAFEGLDTAGQYAAIQVIKVADNVWDVIGGIA